MLFSVGRFSRAGPAPLIWAPPALVRLVWRHRSKGRETRGIPAEPAGSWAAPSRTLWGPPRTALHMESKRVSWVQMSRGGGPLWRWREGGEPPPEAVSWMPGRRPGEQPRLDLDVRVDRPRPSGHGWGGLVRSLGPARAPRLETPNSVHCSCQLLGAALLANQRCQLPGEFEGPLQGEERLKGGGAASPSQGGP